MAIDIDREKERELDDLYSRVRIIEQEKQQLQDKMQKLEIEELKYKNRINEINDDNYVERKLQLLYDQKHENKR